jgi:hypothetical protein
LVYGFNIMYGGSVCPASITTKVFICDAISSSCFYFALRIFLPTYIAKHCHAYSVRLQEASTIMFNCYSIWFVIFFEKQFRRGISPTV